MVKTCVIESGGRERVGAVRTCDVDFGGRTGTTVERCIESVPNRTLAHVTVTDSFGFSRVLSDFWFSFTLEPKTAPVNRSCLQTVCDPRPCLARFRLLEL
jgi:hypothetical protein